MIVITDEKEIVSLGGIIGGMKSAVPTFRNPSATLLEMPPGG